MRSCAPTTSGIAQRRKAPAATAARAFIEYLISDFYLLPFTLLLCLLPSAVAAAAELQLVVLAGLHAVDGVDDTGEHHFFPGLIAPGDIGRRIGIRLIGGGVVVVSDRVDARALRQLQRLREDVLGLPVE